LNLKKDDIIAVISRIRDEIGHENIKPDIQDVIFNEDTGKLLIITSDRPDKSTVIGKGGWVVGRLREEMGLEQVHVEAYPDILLRKYKLELASSRMEELRPYREEYREPLENLLNLLKMRLKNPHDLAVILKDFEPNLKSTLNKNYDAVVAISGGVDSSFSLIISRMMGFNPLAVTVNPGNIILPGHFRKNVENLTKKLGVDHKYLKADMEKVVEGALEGRFHPCGRCSKIIEETIMEYTLNSGISLLIYGDLLATGAQSIIFKGDILRINLPALLSVTKGEVKDLAGGYGVSKSGVYGCPLLAAVHKKYPHMSRFSLQRILRETRAGILEPGEALDLIMSLFN
jgi:uncharacterized protein